MSPLSLSGTRVRLVQDPGRIGVISGRETERAGRAYAQVVFPDRIEYVPADQLEPLCEGGEPAIDLFRRGRLARPVDLYRTLTHIRLSGRLINFIYSLETTETDFYAYQFKPVLKLLQSVSTGILIADEVGLGKTIEAGLIWTELRSRFDLQRLLVVCPAMLREKWARELERRFGVQADVCSASQLVSRLRSVQAGGRQDFAIIASIQGIRPPKDWEEADADGPTATLAKLLTAAAVEEPLIDMIVVDEAHYLRNPESQSHELGSLLRQASQFAVLLSATPVHLKSEDLFHLLRIVDEDAFPRKEMFEYVRQANEHLVKSRDAVLASAVDREAMEERLRQALSHPLLQGSRQLESLLTDLKASTEVLTPRLRVEIAGRLESANLLGFAVTRTRRREIRELRAVREPRTLRVVMNPLEQEFYATVTRTVQEFCKRSGHSEGFLLVMPQRQMASCMAAARLQWGQDDPHLAEQVYEELGIMLPDAEASVLGPLVAELRSRTAVFADLSRLVESDTKYGRLRDELHAFLKANPAEKVVLFSSFRPTIRYLERRLRQDRLSCAALLGGADDHEQILREFAEPTGPSILLSTEVGSEGIDLQFSWVLVNYDLPWNPMKVEQRIGRLDRLGQKSDKIAIWNLVHAATIDERIYERLYIRLGIFERALGGLEPILGAQISELTGDLLRQDLTPAQQEDRIDQTRVAVEEVRRQEEALEQEAPSLVAYGDYIVQQVNAAKDLSRRIEAADIRRYVLDFLSENFPGSEMIQSAGDEAVIEILLSPAAKNALSTFLRARRAGVTTALVNSDPRPIACRFENRVRMPKRPGEEVVNQLHPLVRFVAECAESRRLVQYPAVAIKLRASDAPIGLERGDYLFAVARWIFEAIRTSEQLSYHVCSGGPGEAPISPEDAERLVVLAAERGEDWPTAAADVALNDAATKLEQELLPQARVCYESYAAQMNAQNEDRAAAQLGGLETHLRQQLEKLEVERQRHLERGRSGLAAAAFGKRRKLEERVRRQRLALEEKKQLQHSMEEICVGMIRVV